MPVHRDLSGTQIHVPYAWEYATSVAREGATGLTSDDVGKLSRQLSDNTLWMLTNHSPVTWTAAGGGGGGSGDMTAAVYDPTSVAGDAFDADNHVYSNTASGLFATNVQAAIDELSATKYFGGTASVISSADKIFGGTASVY